jgi:hypothetical protein
MWAIAQIKPTISRAIAVVTPTFAFPAAASRRYPDYSRSWAFRAMSLILGDSFSLRS